MLAPILNITRFDAQFLIGFDSIEIQAKYAYLCSTELDNKSCLGVINAAVAEF